MSGAPSKVDNIQGYSKNDYYTSVATTDDYQRIDFTNAQGEVFSAGAQVIVCDSGNAIDFSFDGKNIHGALNPLESITFDQRVRQCIFLKSSAAGLPGAVRVWAW